MGNDYLTNNCQLNVNSAGGINFEAYRKGIIAEAFIMFLLYFASQLYRSVMVHRATMNEEAEDTHIEMPWHQRRWGKVFAVLYGNHCVALGFVVLFNPMIAGVALAYIHLAFFVGFIVSSLLYKPRLTGIFLTMMTLCNLGLMLAGLIAINYSNYTSATSNVCQYR